MSTDLLIPARTEIADLFARLTRLLDEGRYEDADAIYTHDVVVHPPRGGELRGIDGVVDHLRQARIADEHTQHLISDLLVEFDGEQAVATANQLVYVYRDGRSPHQTSGLRLTYTAVRTPSGWRFREAKLALAWAHHSEPAR
jgi:ketosteroid isomerase-like protein